MRRILLLCPLLIAGATGLASARADACGGTFCDGGQVPMPVDQTGEDVLFIRDGAELEIHVRIQYEGEAERFVWLLPLPAIPEVSVGSDPLFVALANATIPVWSTVTSFEEPPNDGCPPGGCLDLDGGGDPPPPDVVYEEIIGAYEVVVLDSDSVASIIDFFDQNDYAYDPAATPLIQSYLDDGSLITAVKLTAGASVDQIHPLAFRLVTDEPCIPLRLTAVAATDDLSVRAYFLGQQRWAPSNYQHVVLNPLAYDWSGQSFGSYGELLSLAIDEAGGHAFVTDYAGTSGTVSTNGVWREEWDADSLAGMDANMALDALVDMQLIVASQINPHVLAALREFLPVHPNWGAPELDFWLDHARHPALLDMIDFDAVGFAARLDERVFAPGLHAVELLDASPYLTRLHTTISPAEMTLDPTFHPAPDLPDVRERRTATALVHADDDWATYEVPFAGGQGAATASVCVDRAAGWPSLEDLPMALRVEQVPSMGPPQVTVDNRVQVEQWAQTNYSGSACETSGGADTGESGGSGSDDSHSESGDPGLGPTMGASSTCACSSDADGGGWGGLGLGLLVLGAAVQRRRR
ncbi:DUF2330 domain-containing protein [Enhygromyxa salina]|nr:DUF2330 domain-containing protein [Enhygromyxa salina]